MQRRGVLGLVAAAVLAACADRGAKASLDQGKAFLAGNAKQPGVHVLASGLQYRILQSGPPTGLRPKPLDEIKVHYEGKLLNGDIFDSSYQKGVPMVTTPNNLIPAWTEALQLMRPGDIWMLYVPPKLGYGDKGAGPIPPNAVLIFKIELLGVLPDESSVGRG
ncbi:MAG: FKBP-type peptidyl-prolyl cis-trans isomerase [Caulobacterales bacterium]|jgi:FKBP-type peptidyl-prolyl cis-trans isomerase